MSHRPVSWLRLFVLVTDRSCSLVLIGMYIHPVLLPDPRLRRDDTMPIPQLSRADVGSAMRVIGHER